LSLFNPKKKGYMLGFTHESWADKTGCLASRLASYLWNHFQFLVDASCGRLVKRLGEVQAVLPIQCLLATRASLGFLGVHYSYRMQELVKANLIVGGSQWGVNVDLHLGSRMI
jgi:hypothetical protein